MSGPEVTAMALNVVVPAELQWRDVRRGEAHVLTSITKRLLPDGALAGVRVPGQGSSCPAGLSARGSSR